MMDCKVCQSQAKPSLMLELNRPDFPRTDLRFHRCVSCGYLFHDVFDAWPADAMERFYSYPEYLRYDPGDISDRRLERTVRLLKYVCQQHKLPEKPRVLLHGNGTSKAFLKLWVEGWDVWATYAPFTFERCVDIGQAMQMGGFDIVCSIEVAEHFVNPHLEFERVDMMLRSGGVFCGTTCLTDGVVPTGDWHYLQQHTLNAGHCGIWTGRALEHMAQTRGWVNRTEKGPAELREHSHMPSSSVFFQFIK